MRKYDEAIEGSIRVERLVREWRRSDLLEASQLDRILSTLDGSLRRTNVWLRAMLFLFGAVIIVSVVVFLIVTLRPNDDLTVSLICLAGAAGCFVMTEVLILRFNLYRFGIEEAAAVGFGALAGVGLTLATGSMSTVRAEFPEFVGLLTGAVAGFLIYRRYGYTYAAIASLLCLTFAPFQTDASDAVQRLCAVVLIISVFLIVRWRRSIHGDEFPGDDYGTIQAFCWIVLYAFLNLQLFSRWFGAGTLPRTFYWFTYLAIWLLPAVGLWLAARDRDRPLLDVSALMALLTLVTNKSYLGWPHQAWDPILFGLLLIGIAVAIKRWLVVDKHGFTTSRILSSDKRRLSVVGTASTALHGVP